MSQRVARRSNGAPAPFEDGGSLAAQLCQLVDENLSDVPHCWNFFAVQYFICPNVSVNSYNVPINVTFKLFSILLHRHQSFSVRLYFSLCNKLSRSVVSVMCPLDRVETYVIKPGTVFTFAPCNLTNKICGNAPQNSSFLATRNNPPEVATRHRLFWLQEFLIIFFAFPIAPIVPSFSFAIINEPMC